MLFAIAAFVREDVHPDRDRLSDGINEFLGQWTIQPRAAGLLRGENGEEIGHLILIEADSFEAAQRYFSSNPYAREGLYDRTHIAEFAIEVGGIG